MRSSIYLAAVLLAVVACESDSEGSNETLFLDTLDDEMMDETEEADGESASETGDGDGDTATTGDGDSETTGDGDTATTGDGDTATTGDGDTTTTTTGDGDGDGDGDTTTGECYEGDNPVDPHECDPLAQSCSVGFGCYFGDPDGDGPEESIFGCFETVDGWPLGHACEYLNDCAPGLGCVPPEYSPGCVAEFGCCVAYCDMNCPDCEPGTECVSFWVAPIPPEPLGAIGLCLVP